MDFTKGQHFLERQDVLEKEVELAEILENEHVIEIGGGSGNLTKELLKSKAKKIVCFEIEKEFYLILKELENDYKNLKVVFGDALSFEWSFADKIISNIPYYLSEAILVKAINEEIKKMVLIVGEKFMKKICGETKIGFLVRCFYDFNVILKISGDDFRPVTRTDSWMIVFNKKKKAGSDEIFFRDILLFEGKLKNGLLHAFIKRGFTKKRARFFIKSMGLSEEVLDKKCSRITYRLLKRIEKKINEISFD